MKRKCRQLGHSDDGCDAYKEMVRISAGVTKKPWQGATRVNRQLISKDPNEWPKLVKQSGTVGADKYDSYARKGQEQKIARAKGDTGANVAAITRQGQHGTVAVDTTVQPLIKKQPLNEDSEKPTVVNAEDAAFERQEKDGNAALDKPIRATQEKKLISDDIEKPLTKAIDGNYPRQGKNGTKMETAAELIRQDKDGTRTKNAASVTRQKNDGINTVAEVNRDRQGKGETKDLGLNADIGNSSDDEEPFQPVTRKNKRKGDMHVTEIDSGEWKLPGWSS